MPIPTRKLMNPAPGSSLWLLAHELRLAWYGAAVNTRGKRRPGAFAIAAWTLGWVVLHVGAWGLLHKLGPAGMDNPLVGMAATMLLYAAATFMLSTALKASVLALFERGDLDLLLSSPLPSRSIFTVRLLGVASASAGLFLYLFAPLANVALVLGRPGWLGIYVAVGSTALLAACGAMLATLTLVRLLGARRTRTLAQVLAAVAGGLLFLLSQLGNLMRGGTHWGPALERLVTDPAFGPASPLWLPGRAALGQPAALLLLAVLATVALVLTVGRTHRFFVQGVQQAAGAGRARAPVRRETVYAFRNSLFDSVVAKEWRLIARDPQLLSQVLLQLVYLLPMLLLILRGDGGPAPALAAGLSMLSGSLTGGLAWIVISGEEAPDLLRSSPAAMRTIRLAKLAASTMPPLLLIALPLAWLVAQAPVDGLLAAFTSVGSVLGAALVVLWSGRPGARSDFKMRGKENFVASMLELVSSVCWAALAWTLVTLAHDAAGASVVVPTGAAAALAGALLTPALAWLARRRPA
jgi:ABC-2 type transport system permease protein